MCVCFCKLQTPWTSPCKTGLQMVYCIPVGDETGHEMGIRRIRFWCFLKKWKSSNDHPRPRFCCMHVSRVILVRQFQKIRNTYPQTFVPRGFRGGTFPTPFCTQEQPFESVEIKGTGSLQQTFEVQLPRGDIKRIPWNGVLFMFPLGIHGTDIYIYTYIRIYLPIHEWRISMWSM